MSGYDVGSDLQSIRDDLGLAADSSASQVMASLWAKINGTATPATPTIPADVERAARALCRHFGADPDRTVQRRDATGTGATTQPAWMDHVAVVTVVLDAVKPPSEPA